MRRNLLKDTNSQKLSGSIFAAAAYIIWGALPLYWMLLNNVQPFVVVSFRVLFSMAFLSVILFFSAERKEIRLVFTNKKLLFKFIASSVTIFINWSMFIFGISMGWYLDVSFGYFMTPLFQVILGMLFLKEKMDAVTLVSSLLAFAAIIYLMVAQGIFPWFSIVLSISFAIYGVQKKTMHTDAFAGLYLETLFMSPVSIGILIFCSQFAAIPFGQEFLTTFLLVAAGVVTTVPLILYNLAAKRISLISLGFYQYLSPTGTFLIGVLVNHDPVKPYQLVSFSLIWIALIIFTAASIVKARKERQLLLET